MTVGIGYDLGYESAAQIAADWSGVVPPTMLGALQRCAGVRSSLAQRLLPDVRGLISIPFDDAMQVFQRTTLPRYCAGTLAAMPRCIELSSDSFGALVSLSYNRGFNGWLMTDDRHREMLAICRAVDAGQLDQVPRQIRAMKRIWTGPDGRALPGMAGLLTRRDAEAALFEGGLAVVAARATTDTGLLA